MRRESGESARPTGRRSPSGRPRCASGATARAPPATRRARRRRARRWRRAGRPGPRPHRAARARRCHRRPRPVLARRVGEVLGHGAGEDDRRPPRDLRGEHPLRLTGVRERGRHAIVADLDLGRARCRSRSAAAPRPRRAHRRRTPAARVAASAAGRGRTSTTRNATRRRRPGRVPRGGGGDRPQLALDVLLTLSAVRRRRRRRRAAPPAGAGRAAGRGPRRRGRQPVLLDPCGELGLREHLGALRRDAHDGTAAVARVALADRQPLLLGAVDHADDDRGRLVHQLGELRAASAAGRCRAARAPCSPAARCRSSPAAPRPARAGGSRCGRAASPAAARRPAAADPSGCTGRGPDSCGKLALPPESFKT